MSLIMLLLISLGAVCLLGLPVAVVVAVVLIRRRNREEAEERRLAENYDSPGGEA